MSLGKLSASAADNQKSSVSVWGGMMNFAGDVVLTSEVNAGQVSALGTVPQTIAGVKSNYSEATTSINQKSSAEVGMNTVINTDGSFSMHGKVEGTTEVNLYEGSSLSLGRLGDGRRHLNRIQ